MFIVKPSIILICITCLQKPLLQFGDGMLQSALATFVLFSPEREPDAVRVAAAFAILLLPYSFIGPFAGVLLDRWQRRNVLVRANLLKSLFTVPIIVIMVSATTVLMTWAQQCSLPKSRRQTRSRRCCARILHMRVA